MSRLQETCVQRVKVAFFHPSGPDSKASRPTGKKWEDISSMIQRLQQAHNDWNLYASNRQIVMETTTMDFQDITAMLEQNGFTHSDYDLQVEYERKWGML